MKHVIFLTRAIIYAFIGKISLCNHNNYQRSVKIFQPSLFGVTVEVLSQNWNHTRSEWSSCFCFLFVCLVCVCVCVCACLVDFCCFWFFFFLWSTAFYQKKKITALSHAQRHNRWSAATALESPGIRLKFVCVCVSVCCCCCCCWCYCWLDFNRRLSHTKDIKNCTWCFLA